MKLYAVFSCALFALVIPSLAFSADLEVGKDIFKLLIQAGIRENSYRGDAEIGRKICENYKGESCYSVSSLPEGICKAARGTSCYSVSTIGEALCKAGGGSSCYNVSSIGEGFCKMMHGNSCYSISSLEEGICKGFGGYSCYNPDLSRLQPRDIAFAWDKFTAPNAYGIIWACRGIQTGQFVENSKCTGPQIDELWPNN